MVEHSHTHAAFDVDLDAIQGQIMVMGGLVEQAIDESALALEKRDAERAAQVIEADKAIDAREEEVNDAVVRILALRQPRASDLRTVVTMMKIAGNLERVGDYAKNIAKRVAILSEAPQVPGAAGSVRRMARSVRLMLRDVLDAHARRDAALAADVRQRDREVDQMHTGLFREFLTHMMEDPRNITPCMHYLFIAKNLERMGDHVTSIAEQVIFVVTGDLPDDERPKGDLTSTQLISPAPGGATGSADT